MRSSRESLRFVVGSLESLEDAMDWEGSAMERALKEVSTALVGSCLPLPSLSLDFYRYLLRVGVCMIMDVLYALRSRQPSLSFCEWLWPWLWQASGR